MSDRCPHCSTADFVAALIGESQGMLQCRNCELVFNPNDNVRVFSDLDVHPLAARPRYPLLYIQLVSTDGDNLTMTRGMTNTQALKLAEDIIAIVRRHQR